MLSMFTFLYFAEEVMPEFYFRNLVFKWGNCFWNTMNLLTIFLLLTHQIGDACSTPLAFKSFISPVAFCQHKSVCVGSLAWWLDVLGLCKGKVKVFYHMFWVMSMGHLCTEDLQLQHMSNMSQQRTMNFASNGLCQIVAQMVL